MLNLFQYLISPQHKQTLKQVQGDEPETFGVNHLYQIELVSVPVNANRLKLEANSKCPYPMSTLKTTVVMLNLFQHLISPQYKQTLKQVQGDGI